jgi:hypothetical protein
VDALAVDYRLDPAAVRRRARAVALLGSLALIAPGALIAVLVAGQGVLRNGLVVTTALLLLLLAVVRAAVTYGRLVRQLGRFSVRVKARRSGEAEAEAEQVLVLRAGQRTIELRPESIERLVEIAGALGGLRMRIADSELLEVPPQIDIPRGGEGFAELVRAVVAFAPAARFDPPRRRPPILRFARGAAVVAALFFLPFLAVDFIHRSRLLAYGVALLVFVVVRAALRPAV